MFFLLKILELSTHLLHTRLLSKHETQFCYPNRMVYFIVHALTINDRDLLNKHSSYTLVIFKTGQKT